MTNREWFVDKITTMSDEELAHFIEVEEDLWCGDNCELYNCNCEKCMIDWLKKEHIEPMPELKVGMFVKVRHTFGDYGIGVVTQNIVVYENGGFDWISQIKNDVIAIYQANCFDGCNDNNIIWEKS